MMKKLKELFSKYKLVKVYENFLMVCGCLFILLNLHDIYWPSDYELLSGFKGQLFFAIVLAITTTIVKNKNNENQTAT